MFISAKCKISKGDIKNDVMALIFICRDLLLAAKWKNMRWTRGDNGAGVDSGRSLQQDPESDFWMKTGSGAGAGVRISVLQELDN